MIYLDNAASTRRPDPFITPYSESMDLPRPTDREGILRDMATILGNALGANPDHIYFLPNATYAINELAHHLAGKYQRVLLSDEEHSSNHLIWLHLFPEVGFFSLSTTTSLDEPGSIVSYAPLSNLMGTRSPLTRVRASFVIGDLSQHIQHSLLNLGESHFDAVVFSAHKFYGPNGIGVLCVKSPLNLGLNHLNLRDRPNYSLDFRALQAWSKSLPGIVSSMLSGDLARIESGLREYFLGKFPPNDYVRIINANSGSCIFLLQVSTVSAHDYAFYLARNGVVVRSGLSCSWILAERMDPNSILRVSLNAFNTRGEIDILFGLIDKFSPGDCF